MQKFCTIYIVRHGETEWNEKKLIQGHEDIPLNEKGKKQAKKIAEKLRNIHIDAFYSSDLKRASETAKIIAQSRGLKIEASKDLRERYFGKFQGQSFEDKKLMIFVDKHNKSTERKNDFENNQQVLIRFINYIKQIIKKNPGKTILVVSHGGPIRLFLIHLGFDTYENFTEGKISNLAYIKLKSDGISFSIKRTFGIKKRR